MHDPRCSAAADIAALMLLPKACCLRLCMVWHDALRTPCLSVLCMPPESARVCDIAAGLV